MQGSPRLRTSFEPNHRESPKAAPPRAGLMDTTTPEAKATSGARLPTVPQVRLVPDFTTTLHDTTMHGLRFKPLKSSLETFITKLSKSTE